MRSPCLVSRPGSSAHCIIIILEGFSAAIAEVRWPGPLEIGTLRKIRKKYIEPLFQLHCVAIKKL
jgi:hypothetical protein